jgi:hypothetical protein
MTTERKERAAEMADGHDGLLASVKVVEPVRTEEEPVPCTCCGQIPQFTQRGRVLHLGCACGEMKGEFQGEDLGLGILRSTMIQAWNEAMRSTGIWMKDGDDDGE